LITQVPAPGAEGRAYVPGDEPGGDGRCAGGGRHRVRPDLQPQTHHHQAAQRLPRSRRRVEHTQHWYVRV